MRLKSNKTCTCVAPMQHRESQSLQFTVLVTAVQSTNPHLTLRSCSPPTRFPGVPVREPTAGSKTIRCNPHSSPHECYSAHEFRCEYESEATRRRRHGVSYMAIHLVNVPTYLPDPTKTIKRGINTALLIVSFPATG
jgi:hypothetical protein